MKRIKIIETSSLLAIALTSFQVAADEYHYKDILIGDRASGFGGAYTAIADDPSGLYYNPAGIVRAPDSQLSASANAFNQTSYSYSNINSGNKEWVRKSNASLANFFGAFQKVGPGVFGFSIAAPDINKASQDETFHDYQAADPDWEVKDEILNYKEDDATILVGPSYAFDINNRVSIGASLYAHIRNAELEFRQQHRFEYSGADTVNRGGKKGYENRYQKFKTNEHGLKPTLGVLWDATDQFTFGLKIAKTLLLSQNPMGQSYSNTDLYAFKDGTTTQIYTQDEIEGMTDAEVSNLTDGTLTKQQVLDDIPNPQSGTDNPVGMQSLSDRELPLEVSLGLAYFASPSFIVSSDIDYYSATKTYAQTINWSVGTEYFWSPMWSTRTGLYSNNSNNKSLDDPGFDVDEYGLSLNLSKHNRLSVLTFGFNYLYGTGKARLSAGSNYLQDLTIQSMTAYIATSMNF